MISFSKLGQYGRLGNQLFQIATTTAHAMDMATTPIFPKWDYQSDFNVPSEYFGSVPTNYFTYVEEGFEYQALPRQKKMNLHGYFQSYKYFEKYDKAIKNMLELNWTADSHDIVIHVRRGDYLKYPEHHPLLPIEYYEQALNLLPSGKIVAVTDDSQWVTENMPFVDECISGHELADLATIVNAENIVIANSTFSWWGAYMSNAKTIIAPKQWFGSALAHNDTRDLIPPLWNII